MLFFIFIFVFFFSLFPSREEALLYRGMKYFLASIEVFQEMGKVKSNISQGLAPVAVDLPPSASYHMEH